LRRLAAFDAGVCRLVAQDRNPDAVAHTCGDCRVERATFEAGNPCLCGRLSPLRQVAIISTA